MGSAGTFMKIARQAQSLGNYFADGIACGLGGMLLLGVPGFAATVALLESRQFFIRTRLPMPHDFDWLSQASALIGFPVEHLLVFIGTMAVPSLGFMFGWWMGMHHPHPTQPDGLTGRRDYARFVNRASLARRH
jgi:hypothetical protein